MFLFVYIGHVVYFMASLFPVNFPSNIMEPADVVKNLGIILDTDNSMQRHVAYVTTISGKYEGSTGI